MAKQLWNMDLTDPLGIKSKKEEEERRKKQQAEKPQLAYAHNAPEKANNAPEIQMPMAVSDNSPYKNPFNTVATSFSHTIYGTKSGNKPTDNGSFRHPVYGDVTNRVATGVSNYNDWYWGRNIREAQKREQDEYNRLSELVKTPEWKNMTPAQQEAERNKFSVVREGVTKARKEYVADEEHRADFKLQQAWNVDNVRNDYINKGKGNSNNPRNHENGEGAYDFRALDDTEKEYVDFVFGYYDKDTAFRKYRSLINEKANRQLIDSAKDNALVRNVAAPLINVSNNLVAAPVYMGEVLTQGAKNVISGVPRNMPADTVGTQMMKTADASREAFAGDSKIKGLALDTVNSITPAMFGAAAPVVYGMQSGGRSAYDTIQKGGSVGQAGTSAVMNAVVSGVISKYGFDKFFEGGNLARNALKSGLKKDIIKALGMYTLQQGGAEALEEGVESYADTIIDVLVNGDNSDMARLYDAHIKNGHTPEQAQRMALTTKLLTEPTLSAALGGLMGMVIGDVNIAAGTARAYSDYKSTPGSVSVDVGGYAIRNGMSDAEVLEMLRNDTQTGTNADMQYKIMESKENGKVAFLDGKRIGKRNDETRSQAIRRVFNENFKNKPVTVDETKDNVRMDQIGKYIYPGARGINYNQKISALPILDEMIQIGSAKRWSENLLDKSGNVKKHAGYDCSNGFNYYDTKFVIDNSGVIYGGTIIVRLDKNGNAYFYDLDNVRGVGYQDENEFYPAISLSTPLTEDSIPQSETGVNDFQNKLITGQTRPGVDAVLYNTGERMELKGRSEFDSDEAYAHYLIDVGQKELAKVPKITRAFLEAIARRTGLKIVIGDTGAITGQKSAGGYSRSRDMLVLDYDTVSSPDKLARAVINHELVHATETSMFYKSLEKYAFQQMFGGDEKALNDAIKKKQERYARSGVQLGRDGAKAELVASYIGESILTSEEAINKLVIEKPTLAMQIKNALVKTYFKTKTYFTDKETYEARYVLSDLEKGIRLFEKALDTRRNFKDFAQRLSGNVSSDMQYDIRKDKDGSYYVEIEEDILEGVPREDWDKTIRDNLKEKFPNGLKLGERTIAINSTTRNEVTGSNYKDDLGKQDSNQLYDRYNAINNFDEIWRAQENTNLEDRKHDRKDSFIKFVRGYVSFSIGNRDYNAEMLTGITKTGQEVMYDLVNITPTKINKTSSPDEQLVDKNKVSAGKKTSEREVSYNDRIPYEKPIVKSQMQEALEKAGLNDFRFTKPAKRNAYLDQLELEKRLAEKEGKGAKGVQQEPAADIELNSNAITYGLQYALQGDYTVIRDIIPGISAEEIEKSLKTGDISNLISKMP